MTQLEKSPEELNKDRSQFNGTAHVVRQDSKYFLYVKDEGHLFALHITGLEWHRHVKPFGAEMCNFVLLSLFLLPFKGLKKNTKDSGIITFHSPTWSSLSQALLNEDFLNYNSARDWTTYTNLVTDKLRVKLFNNARLRRHFLQMWNICRDISRPNPWLLCQI